MIFKVFTTPSLLSWADLTTLFKAVLPWRDITAAEGIKRVEVRHKKTECNWLRLAKQRNGGVIQLATWHPGQHQNRWKWMAPE